MADPDNPQPPPPPPEKGAEELPRQRGRERKGGTRLGRKSRPSGADMWSGYGWINAACWLLLLVVLGALWLLSGH